MVPVAHVLEQHVEEVEEDDPLTSLGAKRSTYHPSYLGDQVQGEEELGQLAGDLARELVGVKYNWVHSPHLGHVPSRVQSQSPLLEVVEVERFLERPWTFCLEQPEGEGEGQHGALVLELVLVLELELELVHVVEVAAGRKHRSHQQWSHLDWPL